MNIKNLLRNIRKNLDLSQEDLAKTLGVSFTTINRWENGKSIPRQELLDKVRALGSSPKAKITSSSKLVAYSLFSGAGGLHLGLEKAGFEVAVASDFEPAAFETHKINWPQTPFVCEDIRKITSSMLLKAAGGKRPNLIFGGPPCQGFSTLGDKLSSDPRNKLFDEFLRFVGDLKPEYVLMENVKSLVTMYDGQYKDYIIKKLKGLGYNVTYKILNAADYGVPQVRNRVFFVATKLNAPFSFPLATHGSSQDLLPYEKVGKYLSDLSKRSSSKVPNHIILDHSETVIARYKLIPQGGRLPPPEKLPIEIRRKNFGNTYKRLDNSKPALTMVPGNNAFAIHPTLHRSLTPREAARIQTFPDSFIFAGDRRRQCILVGNAVPPLLAKKLGLALQQHYKSNFKDKISTKKIEKLNIDELLLTNVKDTNAIFPYAKLMKKNEEEGFIDLFCGAGGFTIGLGRAGWKPLLGVDFDKSVAQTHKFNFPELDFKTADLSDLKIRDQIVDLYKGKTVGLVVGGPPCQGFSVFGKRRYEKTRGYDPKTDPRNYLVYSFIDIVNRVKPNWFVMENVPGFTTLDDGLFLQEILKKFKHIGYKNIDWKILNAADYGVPQLRKRLVIIGNRTGHIIPWPKKKFFIEPKEWQKNYRGVGEVLSDLATKDSYENYTCHVPMNHKPLLVERYKYIPEGGKLNVDALPEELKKGYRTEVVKNYSHVFKRLHRAHPAMTMVPGHNAFPIHPWLHRALTVREAARIQTFPDEIEFKGTRQEQCIQVGNAFPPLLAEIIGNNIKKAEINNWYPNNVPKSATYSILDTSEQMSLFNETEIAL